MFRLSAQAIFPLSQGNESPLLQAPRSEPLDLAPMNGEAPGAAFVDSGAPEFLSETGLDEPVMEDASAGAHSEALEAPPEESPVPDEVQPTADSTRAEDGAAVEPSPHQEAGSEVLPDDARDAGPSAATARASQDREPSAPEEAQGTSEQEPPAVEVARVEEGQEGVDAGGGMAAADAAPEVPEPTPALSDSPLDVVADASTASAPTMAAVRAQIQRRTAAIQVAPVTAGTGGAREVRSVTESRAELIRLRATDVPRSAETAMPPVPEGLPETLPTPEDPVPSARRGVEVKSGLPLPTQTPPALTVSPFGNNPRSGDRPVSADLIRQLHRVLDEGPPVSDPNDEARFRLLMMRERLMERSAPEPGRGTPVALQEPRPPEVPPLTPARRTQTAQVIARLLVRKGEEAREWVSSARRSAYPNGALERVTETAHLGEDTFAPEFERTLEQQLNAIAAEAGIAEEDLQTAVDERRRVLDERTRLEEESLQMSLPEATAELGGASQAVSDGVAGGRIWMEARARAAEGGASSPTASVTAQRDALLDDINRRVARADALYRRSATVREQELVQAEQDQRAAYEAAAQRDEFQLDEDRGERSQVEVQADVARSTAWLTERQAFLRREFERLKGEARDAGRGYRVELASAGDDGRESIREWAATQLGEERDFWESFLEMLEDWADQTRANAEAWEALQNQETVQAVAGDLAMLDRVQRAASAGISEQALLAANALSAEEQALVHAYFNPDPAEGASDPIGAVAAGMRARIFNQRKDSLESGIRDLFTDSDLHWTVFAEVARAAGNTQFDASHRASEIYRAYHGGITGIGTDEARAFRAMTGLGPLEALALRKCYRQTYGLDLEKDSKGELSGAEYQRARALLEGDRNRADAAALHTAMKEAGWGTGAGTDEAAIMEILRNKTPEEVEQISRLYREMYHQDLQAELREELDDWATFTTHDADRADALLRSDTATADAIAINQQVLGFSWANAFNLTYGTSFEAGARDEVAAIYEQVRRDVTEVPGSADWSNEKFEAEITRRVQAITNAYGGLSSYGHIGGSLEEDLATRFSGPNRDLVLSLARNDQTGADAARLAIERQSTFYASDAEMNRVLESQYDRALDAVRRDMAPERRRALMALLDLEEAEFRQQTGQRWTPAERWRRQQLVERQIEAELEVEARALADGNMTALSQRYAGTYSESLATALDESTSGVDGERARTLLRQGGYLTRYQRFDFSVRGAGTDEQGARRAIEGASRAELEEMRAQWARENPGETLDGRAASELSGSDDMDMRIALMGAPETIEDRVRIERARMALEEPSQGIAGPEQALMQIRLAQLEALADRMYDADVSPEERARLLGDFDFHADAVRTAVEDHRAAVAEMTDSIANVVGITVALIVGGVGAIFTGGASAAIALAIIASMASTAASMGTRWLLLGNQYGHEEILMDLGLGLVDALVGGLTAGFGNRLLGISQIGRAVAAPVVTRAGMRGAAQRLSMSLRQLFVGSTGRLTQATRSIAMLERMLQGGRLSQLAAHGIAQTMENAVQSLPSAVIANVANDQVWEHGNPLVNIVRGTSEQMGHGLALGLAMSAGHASVSHVGGAAWRFARGPRLGSTPDVLSHEHLLTSPESHEAALREFQRRNPGSSEQDFQALVNEQRRLHLEGFLAEGRGRTEADFNQMLEGERAARIAEYQQMHPGRTSAEFDADVGRRSGEAHSEVSRTAKALEAVRTQMEEGLPEDARALAREVPVTSVSASEMARLQGSLTAEAAVVIRDGQVHLVVREGANPAAVREQAARLVELVEPGTAGRAKDPSLSLPRDLRDRVPVHVNPKLTGGSVQVHYVSHKDVIVGVWLEVGPQARAVDIHMHVQTARSMRQLQGLSGSVQRLLAEVRQWFGANPGARPGTIAWEARLELEKLPRIIQERAQALRLATDPDVRTRIAFEIETLRLQVETHTANVRAMSLEPGVGFVAATVPDEATVVARLAEMPPELRQILRERGPLVEAYVAMNPEFFRTLVMPRGETALAANEVSVERTQRLADILLRLLGGRDARDLASPGLLPLAETHLHLGGMLEAEHIVRHLEALIDDTANPGSTRGELNRWIKAVNDLLSGREERRRISEADRARFTQSQKDARAALKAYDEAYRSSLVRPTPEDAAVLHVLREKLIARIQAVVSMPLADATMKPLLTSFFAEFVRQKRFLLGRKSGLELLTMAASDLHEHGASMLELRQGLSDHVEAWFEAMRQSGADFVQGLIVTQVKNYAADPKFIPEIMRRIRDDELAYVLGFDLSGLESGGRGKDTVGLRAAYLKPFLEVHQYNRQQLVGLLEGNEGLRDGVQQFLESSSDLRFHFLVQRLGLPANTPPLVVAERLAQAIQDGTVGARELGVWNRVMRDAITHVGVEHQTNYLAPRDGFRGLLGITVHAGEQVRGQVSLSSLLEDVRLVLDYGSDRVGHGVILGTSFVDPGHPVRVNSRLMASLGFKERKGVWVRGKERYTVEALLAMEQKRRQLLVQAVNLGVVIEINPTSNVLLSGLDPWSAHPVARMLQDEPALRVSVNTDNAGMHLTNPRLELAYLLATESLTYPQAVRVVLEGFASRMGGRPIADAENLRKQMEDAIVLATRTSGERMLVLEELARRYGLQAPAPATGIEVDDGAFRQALSPYLRLILQ